MSPAREPVVARLRPHGRALFGPTLVLMAVATAVGYLSGTWHEVWQNALLLAAAGLVVALGWLVPLLRYLGHRYTITSGRVIVRRGVIVRSRQEMPFTAVQEVTVRRGPVQSVFRTADVIVSGAGSHRVVLADVASADLVQSVLVDLVDRSDPGENTGTQRLPGSTRFP